MGHSTLIANTAGFAAAALTGLCVGKVCTATGMGEENKRALQGFVSSFACLLATSYAINIALADPVGAGVTTTTAVASGVVGANIKA